MRDDCGPRRDLIACQQVSEAREKALSAALQQVDDALDALATTDWTNPTTGDLRRVESRPVRSQSPP